MRLALFATAVLTTSSVNCAGGVEHHRLPIASARIVTNGRELRATWSPSNLASNHLVPTSVGIVPSHLVCGNVMGVRLDDAGETHAEGGSLASCDPRHPREPVAQCGETVTLVLWDQEDAVLATFATTYECLFEL